MMNRFILFLEHSFALIREDKLYSTIYIAGTAVAIASAMVIAIVLHTMVADIAPEVNRSRTLYLSSNYFSKQQDSLSNHTDGVISGQFSDVALDSCFRKMESVELATGVGEAHLNFCDENFEKISFAYTMLCDPDFFRLYEFTFLDGRPFSEKEYKDGERVCVISDRTAQELGYPQTVIASESDKRVRLRVVGVVKSVSSLLKTSSAVVYLPHGLSTEFFAQVSSGIPSYMGNLDARILLRKGYSYRDFVNELKPLVKHYNAILNSQHGDKSDWEVYARLHFLKQLNFYDDLDPTLSNCARNLVPPILLMLLFLFLPAINLSGMVTNRMEARRAEMGIRKAFGAKRRTLLNEVIHENLVLTLCGGLVGWVLSVFFIRAVRESEVFASFFSQNLQLNYNPILEMQMYITPTLFIIAFLCCAVLNLMAALIPAWRSLRKPIVESLNQKR